MKSSYHTHQFSHFILHIISLPQPSFRSCTSSHCREQRRDPSPHQWSPQAATLQEYSEAAWPSFTASVPPDPLRAGAATSCLATSSTIQEVRRSCPPLQLLSLGEGEYPSQGQMPTKNVLYPPIVFYSAVATVLFNHDELYRERYLPFICCRYCVSAEFLFYIWESLIC